MAKNGPAIISLLENVRPKSSERRIAIAVSGADLLRNPDVWRLFLGG